MTKRLCNRSKNRDEWGEEIVLTMYDHFLKVNKKRHEFIKGLELGELPGSEEHFPFLVCPSTGKFFL